MSYSSSVLAHSPHLYLRCGESSGATAADSSGNGRDATIAGTITYGVAGAILGDSDTAFTLPGTTSTGSISLAYSSWMNVSTFTTLCWFKTSDTGINYLVTRWSSSAGSSVWGLDLQSSDVIRAYARLNGNVRTVSATVTGLRDNAWHLAAVTYDGTDLILNVDGVTEGSAAWAGPLTQPTASAITPGWRTAGASTEQLNGSLDEVYFGPALTEAQILALYEAATELIIAGEAFGSSATMLDGTPLVGISVAGEAFASSATFLDGSVGGGPVTVSGEAFATAATMLDGSALTAVSVAGEAFVSSATMLDGAPVLGPVGGDAFAVTMTMLDGGVVVTSATDTSNFYNGRRRGGLATVELDVPVTAPPVAATVVRVDKAIALPQPVLVKGRPT